MTDAVRLSRGCWIDADLVDDLDVRCAAMIAVTGPDTVVTGYTAARLHGFWLPARHPPVQVATRTPGRPPRAMSRSRRPELLSSRRVLPDEHLRQLRGIPVTSAARTWVDLRLELTLPDLVAAGDSVLRSGTDVAELSDVIGQLAGRRGIRTAVRALTLLDAGSRSRAESHLRVAVSRPDLPRFAVNHPVVSERGEWLAEPDLSCADARLALEYQGEDHADVRRMRRDITRMGDLRRAGWLVIPYGPAEVFGRPWQIASDVRSELRRRAPELLRLSTRRVATSGPGGPLRAEWSADR